MKNRIIFFLLLLPCTLFAQQNKKLLPVFMESDDGLTQFELLYDDQNRMILQKYRVVSPFDSTMVYVTTKTLSYSGDSLITVDYLHKINEMTADSSVSHIYCRNNALEVRTGPDYQAILIKNAKEQLIKTTFLRPSTSYEYNGDYKYDRAGNLSEFSTEMTAEYKSIHMLTNHKYFYPVKNDKKGVLSAVNSPDWLLHYIFNSICGFLNNASSAELLTKYNDEDPKTEYLDMSYEYDEQGYPVVIKINNDKKDKEQMLRIVYTEAKR